MTETPPVIGQKPISPYRSCHKLPDKVLKYVLSSQSDKLCHIVPVGEVSRLDLFTHYRLAPDGVMKHQDTPPTIGTKLP